MNDADNKLSTRPDPELPLVDGPKEYDQQRALFVHLDDLLGQSDLEGSSIDSKSWVKKPT